MGSALARACVGAGHTVVLSARRAHDRAAKVAADVGGRAAASNAEAVEGADLVMLAVPSTSIAAILEEIDTHVDGKTVVDVTNPVAVDYTDILRSSGSVAEGVQLLAPTALVVKAFNTVFASRIIDPVVDGIRLDGFYAGDDEAAKSTVGALVGAIGLRPIDAGELLAARALELMGTLNTRLNMRNGRPWQSGWKLLGPTG
jgi:8-hydroxy-5-deazaflavin:NADPH oxidoreductase